MGKEPNSFHRASEQAMIDLMNQSQHIQKVLENFNSNQIASNRLQLKALIDVVKVLAFQGLAFRGQYESSDSINCGNFLEILDLVVSYNEYVILVQTFFNRLSSIVNVVGASCKRTEQLKKTYADQIAYFVEIGELETGRGLNQISTLQRAGDTHWGSHLRSISRLVNIFSPTCEILLEIIKEGNTTSQ